MSLTISPLILSKTKIVDSGGGGNVAPSNVTAPVISGSTSLGSVLTTTNGTWSGTPATFSYTYQWKRNGSPIGGATASTYTTVVADSLANITCDVTADNGVSPTATAGSNTLTMANYTPANTVPPAVTGTAVVGQTLSTTNGTWTNSPSTYSYQWYRGATPIGSNSSSYTLVSADAGQNIKCTVTATNTAGSASADSNTVAILATLLDLYPNAAAAYSVRLLRGAYLGSSAIRVRRSNDNAELNIGFTASGNLDTTALTTFVGSNSGFIVTWYDQSGSGNNASQTTPASQPRIVNAGVIDVLNGKPSIKFNGTSNSLLMTSTISPSGGVYSCYGVGRRTASLTPLIFFGNSTTATSIGLNHDGGNNRIFFLRSTGFLQSAVNATASYNLISGFAAATNALRRNGVVLSTAFNSFAVSNNINAIGISGTTVFTNGDIQEDVLWQSDLSSTITNIETNTNTYYGIY